MKGRLDEIYPNLPSIAAELFTASQSWAYSLNGGVQFLSHARLFAIPWTVAQQSPLSIGLSSKNSGVGCHFLLQGIFPTQGSNLNLLNWQADSLSLSHQVLIEYLDGFSGLYPFDDYCLGINV